MHQFEKEKTVLELKAQYVMTLFNIILGGCFSILIAIWVSDIGMFYLKWKIIGTIFTIILAAILFKSMKFQLEIINDKINHLI